MDFINKTDREKIERLNQVLNTCYRSKPYDIKNPKDMIDVTSRITSAYLDLRHYWSMIDDICSSFDESLEVFYPVMWFDIIQNGTTYDELTDQAINYLNKTEKIFYDLMFRAENKCIEIWNLILCQCNDEVIEYFFNKELSYKYDVVKNVLENNIDEILMDVTYEYNMEKASKEFAKYLYKYLKSNDLI